MGEQKEKMDNTTLEDKKRQFWEGLLDVVQNVYPEGITVFELEDNLQYVKDCFFNIPFVIGD